MNKKIRITQQDIDTAVRDDAFGCAIAVALNREFDYEISVSGWIRVGKDYYQAQDEVRDWIANFDRDKPVKPITIELVDTYVLEKYRPKFFVHTPHRVDARKARRTPTPPDLQVSGIARIAD